MDAADPIDDGRYRLVELLGAGGMAAVYRAWDSKLETWRAVKVLNTRAASSDSVRSRFEDEAKAMARLQHARILTVHEFGLENDRPFIVMELVPGGSLGDILERDGPLRPHLACEVLALVLDALQFAHDNHVVHRDIKPHNIMLTADGSPLVADFGIARIGGELESARTRTGVMMGTLAYMAPEQRTSARQVDGRADVYAAGNTLYALLTGEEPFDLYALTDDSPELLGIPEALRGIVRKATQHSAAARYATAAEMAAALRDAMPAVEGIAAGVASFGQVTQWDSAPPLTPAPVAARTASNATFGFDALPEDERQLPEVVETAVQEPAPVPERRPLIGPSGILAVGAVLGGLLLLVLVGGGTLMSLSSRGGEAGSGKMVKGDRKRGPKGPARPEAPAPPEQIAGIPTALATPTGDAVSLAQAWTAFESNLRLRHDDLEACLPRQEGQQLTVVTNVDLAPSENTIQIRYDGAVDADTRGCFRNVIAALPGPRVESAGRIRATLAFSDSGLSLDGPGVVKPFHEPTGTPIEPSLAGLQLTSSLQERADALEACVTSKAPFARSTLRGTLAPHGNRVTQSPSDALDPTAVACIDDVVHAIPGPKVDGPSDFELGLAWRNGEVSVTLMELASLQAALLGEVDAELGEVQALQRKGEAVQMKGAAVQMKSGALSKGEAYSAGVEVEIGELDIASVGDVQNVAGVVDEALMNAGVTRVYAPHELEAMVDTLETNNRAAFRNCWKRGKTHDPTISDDWWIEVTVTPEEPARFRPRTSGKRNTVTERCLRRLFDKRGDQLRSTVAHTARIELPFGTRKKLLEKALNKGYDPDLSADE